MPPPYRLDAPWIQLRLYTHAPTTAGRADQAFAGRRDRRVHRKAETVWQNLALTTAGVAVYPGELAVAVKVGQGHGLGRVGHHAAPNQSNVRRSPGSAGFIEAAKVESATRLGADLSASALEQAKDGGVGSMGTAFVNDRHPTISQIMPRGGPDRD